MAKHRTIAPGTLVRMKVATLKARRGSLAHVMGDRNGLTEVYTEAGPASACLEEVAVVRQPTADHRPMRLHLPYGTWTEPDGARVLFSRDYMPLWRLRDGQPPEALPPWLWIEFTSQVWNWTDVNPPWLDRATERKTRAILSDAGVTADPPLMTALDALCSGAPHRPRDLQEAVARMAPPADLERHPHLRRFAPAA